MAARSGTKATILPVFATGWTVREGDPGTGLTHIIKIANRLRPSFGHVHSQITWRNHAPQARPG